MGKKNEEEYSYFEHDETVKQNYDGYTPKPLLLRASVIVPLLFLVALTGGAFMFMNMISDTL